MKTEMLREVFPKWESQIWEFGPIRHKLHRIGIWDETIRKFKLGFFRYELIDDEVISGVAVPYIYDNEVIGACIYKYENDRLIHSCPIFIGDVWPLWNSQSISRLHTKPVAMIDDILDALILYDCIGDFITPVAISHLVAYDSSEYLDSIGRVLRAPVIVMISDCENSLWCLQEWEKTLRYYDSDLRIVWTELRGGSGVITNLIDRDLSRSQLRGMLKLKIEEALKDND